MGIEEILEGEFTLDVVNFTKHNPGKTTAWFKLRVDWFRDPAMARLTPTERYLFVTFCSLRAASQQPIGNVCATSLQRICNLSGRSLKRCIANLYNQGLISLERKKEREKEREETGKNSIHADLSGIDDLCFSKISLPAQVAWIKKYGLAVVREVVPVAHAGWISERPVGRTGLPTPLALYIDRCLQNRIKYGDAEPQDDASITRRELAKLRGDG